MGMTLAAATLMLGATAAAGTTNPPPCTELPCPADLATVERVLEEVSLHPSITVTEEGRSAGGRPLYAVRIGRAGGDVAQRFLMVGQQHGDEPAGKDALLHLIARFADHPELVPAGLELWIVPMANPDGAVAGRRRNDADADLNRDHLLLSQPETRMLHGLARRVRPEVVIDCHEFNRSSSEYLDRGWDEWPLIMMDTANHPLLPESVYRNGLAWLRVVAGEMDSAGIRYQRYLVGGPPPDGELRPSTLEGDDARNGLAIAAGGLGFIIESGVRRASKDPQGDIADRVTAYLSLLELFLSDPDFRQAAISAAAESRSLQLPEFVATNSFWGTVDPEPGVVRVVSRATGNVIDVPAPNLMTDRVFKRWVAMPRGYVIEAAVADAYRELLDRHGIDFEVSQEPTTSTVEACRLDRTETTPDEVYERYPGRQITSCRPASAREFASGSLMVHLEPATWRSTVALLEPTLLYGLYQYDEFQATVADDGTIPVWRIVSPGL